MFIFVRAFARLSLGVLGVLFCLSGCAMLFAGIGGRFRPLVSAGASNLLIGSTVAYWAFFRAPWEAEQRRLPHDEPVER